MSDRSGPASGYLLKPPRSLREACAEIHRTRGKCEPLCEACRLADLCDCSADGPRESRRPPE